MTGDKRLTLSKNPVHWRTGSHQSFAISFWIPDEVNPELPAEVFAIALALPPYPLTILVQQQSRFIVSAPCVNVRFQFFAKLVGNFIAYLDTHALFWDRPKQRVEVILEHVAVVARTVIGHRPFEAVTDHIMAVQAHHNVIKVIPDRDHFGH